MGWESRSPPRFFLEGEGKGSRLGVWVLLLLFFVALVCAFVNWWVGVDVPPVSMLGVVGGGWPWRAVKPVDNLRTCERTARSGARGCGRTGVWLPQPRAVCSNRHPRWLNPYGANPLRAGTRTQDPTGTKDPRGLGAASRGLCCSSAAGACGPQSTPAVNRGGRRPRSPHG